MQQNQVQTIPHRWKDQSHEQPSHLSGVWGTTIRARCMFDHAVRVCAEQCSRVAFLWKTSAWTMHEGFPLELEVLAPRMALTAVEVYLPGHAV